MFAFEDFYNLKFIVKQIRKKPKNFALSNMTFYFLKIYN